MITEHPTATVVSNNDPAKAGRVKVEMAELDGDQWPEWLEPIFPGGQWVCIPEPGDTVECVLPEGEDKIEFASEVKYRGVVLDPKNAVPSQFKTNYPNRRGFQTKAGHVLIVDDKIGTFTIANGKTGITIEMDSAGILHLGAKIGSDFLLKGTTFNAAQAVLWPLIGTFISAAAVAFAALAVDTGLLPLMQSATITALQGVATTATAATTGGIVPYLAGAVARLSLKVKTV